MFEGSKKFIGLETGQSDAEKKVEKVKKIVVEDEKRPEPKIEASAPIQDENKEDESNLDTGGVVENVVEGVKEGSEALLRSDVAKEKGGGSKE